MRYKTLVIVSFLILLPTLSVRAISLYVINPANLASRVFIVSAKTNAVREENVAVPLHDIEKKVFFPREQAQYARLLQQHRSVHLRQSGHLGNPDNFYDNKTYEFSVLINPQIKRGSQQNLCKTTKHLNSFPIRAGPIAMNKNIF